MKNCLSSKRTYLRIWKIAGYGFCMVGLLASMVAPGQATEPPAQKTMTMAEIVAAAKPEDWRALDLENTLYLELSAGRVVIELASAFAPHHVANVKALAREHYYDGLAIIRVQDNYVVQWGDPEADNPQKARKILQAKKTLAAEFDRAIDAQIPFSLLPDGDVYAKEVGFSGGFPVARDKGSGRMWLVHGYGMVGAGRGDTRDSGGGAEIYVVIGQAPRHLDRNITLFGRVVLGMELLSALPRASGPMGFYEKPEQYVPIKSIRVAADVPLAERTELEVMRTGTDTFGRLVESRRNRPDAWFLFKAGRVELCNVPVPVRKKESRSAEAQVPDPAALTQRFQAPLARVKAWQEQAADLHPAFAKTHPVALVVDGQFYVFEAAAAGKGWNLSAQAPVKFPIPAGIRAAMPLAFWNNRIACVVSPEVFASPEGYAVILHEFVHCFQWETVEGKLKEGLAVSREAFARGDYMWELQHPFPYGNAEIKRVYDLWQDALQKDRLKKAGRWRSVLKKGLNSRDWEYMAWQEWKEGLARYLENLVRIRFGLKANRPVPDALFNRVSFYRGGELFITRLQESEPGLDKDLERLFQRIFASGS